MADWMTPSFQQKPAAPGPLKYSEEWRNIRAQAKPAAPQMTPEKKGMANAYAESMKQYTAGAPLTTPAMFIPKQPEEEKSWLGEHFSDLPIVGMFGEGGILSAFGQEGKMGPTDPNTVQAGGGVGGVSNGAPSTGAPGDKNNPTPQMLGPNSLRGSHWTR